jgi:hypothetical protein
VVVKDWNGSLGNYDHHNDVINLNIRQIRKIYSHHRKQISFVKSVSDYIILITCHELGHRDDEQILEPVSTILDEITENQETLLLLDDISNEVRDKVVKRCLEREMAAWNLGKKYVNPERLIDYDLMNDEYIESKRIKYYQNVSELIENRVKMIELKNKKQAVIENYNEKLKTFE